MTLSHGFRGCSSGSSGVCAGRGAGTGTATATATTARRGACYDQVPDRARRINQLPRVAARIGTI